MKRKNTRDLFPSSDMSLTAALVSLGYAIWDLDRSDPSRVVFEIERDGKLDEVLERYWRGEMLVEPRAYFAALRDVKSRIYQ